MAEAAPRFTSVARAAHWDCADLAGAWQAALAGGEVIKDEAETLLVRAGRGPTACWWKLYRVPARRRWWARFARSRALREWRALRAMAARGLPVAEPLGCAEDWRDGWLHASLLVTRHLHGGGDLHRWLAAHPGAAERREALAAAGRAARALHDAGVGHFRMLLKNLILTQEGGRAPRIYWLDVPYACFWPTAAPRAVRRIDLVDLAGRDSGLAPAESEIVLRAYDPTGSYPMTLAGLRARRPFPQKLRRIAAYLGAIHSGRRPAPDP